jgi:hypothetical protein
MNRSLFLFGALILFKFSMVSCQNKEIPELKQLDSLEKQLGEIALKLNIDDETIRSREKEMEERMKQIRFGYTEEYSAEMAQKMSRYQGVSKVYRKSLSLKDKYEEELDFLYKQVQGLRNSVEDKKINRTEFQKYLEEESKEAYALLEKSSELHSKLYGVELEYQRLSAYVEEIITRIDTSNQAEPITD